MPTYIRCYWPEDDLWLYDELDDERWSLRHVEVRDLDGVIVAAAALDEVLVARDLGGIDAVRAYESRYGIAPEAPFPEICVDYPIEPIDRTTFEDLWHVGRQMLGSHPEQMG